jgi:hypothetical protein
MMVFGTPDFWQDFSTQAPTPPHHHKHDHPPTIIKFDRLFPKSAKVAYG